MDSGCLFSLVFQARSVHLQNGHSVLCMPGSQPRSVDHTGFGHNIACVSMFSCSALDVSLLLFFEPGYHLLLG